MCALVMENAESNADESATATTTTGTKPSGRANTRGALDKAQGQPKLSRKQTRRQGYEQHADTKTSAARTDRSCNLKNNPECEVIVFGELGSAAGFKKADALRCTYEVMHGENWRVELGQSSGASHAVCATDGEHVFSQPLDVCLRGTELVGWPSLALTLSRVDPWKRREVSFAHAHAFVPNAPGMHTLTCPAWSPQPAGSKKRSGKPHVLSQLLFARDRNGVPLATAGVGNVQLRLNVIVRSLHRIPVHLPRARNTQQETPSSPPESPQKQTVQSTSPPRLHEGEETPNEATLARRRGRVPAPAQTKATHPQAADLQGSGTKPKRSEEGDENIHATPSDAQGSIAIQSREHSGLTLQQRRQRRHHQRMQRSQRQQSADATVSTAPSQMQEEQQSQSPPSAVLQSLELDKKQREQHKEIEEQWSTVQARRKTEDD